MCVCVRARARVRVCVLMCGRYGVYGHIRTHKRKKRREALSRQLCNVCVWAVMQRMCMYEYVCKHEYVCMVCIHAMHAYIRMYVFMLARGVIHTFIHTRTCIVCIHACTRSNTYIHTYTYLHCIERKGDRGRDTHTYRCHLSLHAQRERYTHMTTHIRTHTRKCIQTCKRTHIRTQTACLLVFGGHI